MTTETPLAWLSAKQVAARYGVSVGTVWRWSSYQKGFPKPRKFGSKSSRWSSHELEQWENSRETAQ